jgi:tetratricopeptide (TPR) repeat protein
MPDSLELDLSIFANMPDEDLNDILAAIKQGAERPAELFGFDEPALNAIENIALGFYRARLWDRASLVFGFALRLDPERGSCWRGLGACAHANNELQVAKVCYENALERDPSDLISKVFLGECLCLGGEVPSGLKLLGEAVETGSGDPAVKPYITRARAIVAADGGLPPPLVLKKKGVEIAQDAAKMLAEAGIELDPGRELHLEDIKNNPELASVLVDLTKAFEEGRLSLAEVGGFTDNELDGAYVCACKYAEMGQLGEALQIAGYLIFIDPYKARYYQLVGIALQRLKAYEPAEHFYVLALTLEPNEPRSLVYRGETKIMMGRIDEGLEHIREGIKQAQSVPDLSEVVERGKTLVKQFSA